MKLVVTVLEETMERAIASIRGLRLVEEDWIEVRAERFPSIDMHALRASTDKPMILTYRNAAIPNVKEALAAGINFVDVEWRESVTIEAPERTVLSHHDYEGVRDIEAIWSAMIARGCAHTKLAATPQTFAQNQRVLALLDVPAAGTQLTVMGMSERGLYSRVLAPFRGSALAFVAGPNIGAPGQLTLSRAVDIYSRHPQSANKVFAILGDPAGHSLSPSIHNRLFREKGVAAAYTIASFASFEEIEAAFLAGEPCGLSVTTPYKDTAFAFAERIGAEIGSNAARARAVNTLVRLDDGRVLADNTDVDGFAALLPKDASKAAVLGAGGTARAAQVALAAAGISFVRYNRTVSKADASLDDLRDFDGNLVINTLPGNVDVSVPRCRTLIQASYQSVPRQSQAQKQRNGTAARAGHAAT
jgi:3-dehydroquinate dehydratase type I